MLTSNCVVTVLFRWPSFRRATVYQDKSSLNAKRHLCSVCAAALRKAASIQTRSSANLRASVKTLDLRPSLMQGAHYGCVFLPLLANGEQQADAKQDFLKVFFCSLCQIPGQTCGLAALWKVCTSEKSVQSLCHCCQGYSMHVRPSNWVWSLT